MSILWKIEILIAIAAHRPTGRETTSLGYIIGAIL